MPLDDALSLASRLITLSPLPQDEYGNFNTLKHRLQQLALSMGARAAKKTSQQAQQQQGQASPQTQQQQPAQQQPVVPKTEGSDGRKVMVNMQDINPMMNPAPAPGQVANGEQFKDNLFIIVRTAVEHTSDRARTTGS